MWGGQHNQWTCSNDGTILLYSSVTTADSAGSEIISENQSYLQNKVFTFKLHTLTVLYIIMYLLAVDMYISKLLCVCNILSWKSPQI